MARVSADTDREPTCSLGVYPQYDDLRIVDYLKGLRSPKTYVPVNMGDVLT